MYWCRWYFFSALPCRHDMWHVFFSPRCFLFSRFRFSFHLVVAICHWKNNNRSRCTLEENVTIHISQWKTKLDDEKEIHKLSMQFSRKFFCLHTIYGWLDVDCFVFHVIGAHDLRAINVSWNYRKETNFNFWIVALCDRAKYLSSLLLVFAKRM